MAKDNEYKVLSGIDYPPNKRAEAGEVVSDLPKDAISWLLASGVIELASSSKTDSVEEVVEAVIEALSNDLPLTEEDVDGE
jgi:hypothetical protein